MTAWFKSINVGTAHTVNSIVRIQILIRRAFVKSRDKDNLKLKGHCDNKNERHMAPGHYRLCRKTASAAI
ncbi:MAG: hypothetical protein VB119_12750 [Candidatus Metalachnospira sp.]|nr:hypothetical protein [Candidatus Metalachnospira sp.]